VNTIEIFILLIMAFLPAIIYAIWIRNTEKYNREKWKPIIICFLWGASVAIIASLMLEILLGTIVIVSIQDTSWILFFMVVVIAPFVEELTKPLALSLKSVRKELDEPEDGLIYGAVAGLGFSATENLFYGYDAFVTQGILFFFILMAIRSFAGCLLHASATAWTGYGYGKYILRRSKFSRVIPYFLLAILIHALYNFLPVFGTNLSLGIGFFAAILLVVLTIYVVRKKIMQLDRAAGENIL